MAAAKYDMILEQDSDWVRLFTWYDRNEDPVDIENWGARLVISDEKSKDATVYVDIREGEGITLGADDGDEQGQIQIRIPLADINSMFAGEREIGVWQLYLFQDPGDPSVNKIRLLEGNVLKSASNIPTS